MVVSIFFAFFFFQCQMHLHILQLNFISRLLAGRTTKSDKAGITFPVGRIRRRLKQGKNNSDIWICLGEFVEDLSSSNSIWLLLFRIIFCLKYVFVCRSLRRSYRWYSCSYFGKQSTIPGPWIADVVERGRRWSSYQSTIHFSGYEKGWRYGEDFERCYHCWEWRSTNKQAGPNAVKI